MIKKYGAYALIAGLAIAVIVGIFPSLEDSWVEVALVILGVVGGALNINNEKTGDFLMAGVALMLAAGRDSEITSAIAKVLSKGIANTIEHILANIFIVTAAATLVLAVKTIVAAAQQGNKQ